MNFKARAFMIAKAVGVWWGIFLILGCCIGFAVNIFLSFFAFSGIGRLEMRVFAPILLSGSLLLSVFAYALSSFLDKLPRRKMRKRLDKTALEKGICREYNEILSAGCRGDMRNFVCAEAALSALVSGNITRSEEQLDRIDVVSVLDIARSTGDFTVPAYCYAAEIVLSDAKCDYDSMNTAYINGKPYIDELDYDFYILSVKALYELKTGNPETALETSECADVLRRSPTKDGLYIYKAISAAISARVFFSNGVFDAAEEAVLEAMGIKITAEFENEMIALGREIKENSKAAAAVSDF